MSQQGGCSMHLGSSFTEDAPRPPVPGEEGELVRCDGHHYSHSGYSKHDVLKSEGSAATPRRPDLDLGYEPEGSASPTPPYVKWAESLHSLLDDQEGIHLFKTFLEHEGCADVLDFWFVCSGFRNLGAHGADEEKKTKVAKAIYKKYILDNSGIVSRQIKPPTKCFIKDCVVKLHIDPAMFDQAQAEIQTMMEENIYPLFLKSDIYLEYSRTGGESPKQSSSCLSGSGKVLSGYLPTLNEDEEWRCVTELEEHSECDSTPSNQLTQKLLMETGPQHVAIGARYQECQEYRHSQCREHINPYYVNTGYAMAPATSANDSEQQSMSSDADTLSLTDSSVDGVPPYRHRKQHRREMHESAKANGRVPLPHIPRTNRIPKDIHMEPERFAAELITRLEVVLRQKEAQEKLEERLKRVQLQEEADDMDLCTAASSNHRPPSAYGQHYNHLLPRDAHEENPESILDDHVKRVMKTPGCQSPGTGRHTPKSRSPDGFPGGKAPGPPLSSGQASHQARHGLKGGETSYLHHHHKHHTGPGKVKGQVELEVGGGLWTLDQSQGGSRSRNYADGMGSNPMDISASSKGVVVQCKRTSRKAEDVRPYDMPVPPEEVERNQKIILWMMEGEKETVRHKRSPYGSTADSRKTSSQEASRTSSAERPGAVHPWVSTPLRNSVQPSHPFIQDPTMPPNPAPNPLTQLEEARRRLEEEKIKCGASQPKQRYVMEVIQRGRTAVRPALFPALGTVPAVSDSELSDSQHKTPKKQPFESITVAYYFCGEPIPYRTSVKGWVITLGQFKELLTKKGNYRYYFKKVSDEFDCGVVFEEIREDDAILPIFEDKIIGKVEKID